MKKYIFITALFTVLGASAQITIDKNDMPSLHDTVRYSVANPVNVVNINARLNQNGANQTWDFSDLVVESQGIASFKSAINIKPIYFLSFGSSTYGTQSPNMTVASVQATNIYNFYTQSDDCLVSDGRAFEIELSPLPLAQKYDGKDTIYRFPLNYEDKDSSNYISEEVDAGLGTLNGGAIRLNRVDGWGSITTPFGTFDCLRVRSIVVTHDTIRSSFLPIPFPFTQFFLEYKWLAKGQKIPILEIRVANGITEEATIRYKDIYRPEAFVNKARFTVRDNKLNYVVNSTTDTCVITNASPDNPKSVQWTITPNTFTYTGGTSATSNEVKIFFTDTVKYTVTIRAIYEAGFDDTTSVDLINVSSVNGVKEITKRLYWELSPNPVSDKLLIKSSGVKIKQLEVFDITGKTVQTLFVSQSDNQWQLDCSALTTGIYFVKLTNAKGETDTRKFSVE